MRTVGLGMLIVSLAACASSKPRVKPRVGEPEELFPQESEGLSIFGGGWACLDRAGEHRLTSYGDHVYRFVWQGGHQPVVIRAEETTEGVDITAKILAHRVGTQDNRVAFEKTISVPRDSWKHFKKKFERSGFWAMDVEKQRQGLDGSMWYLEVVDGQRDHVVARWSPRDFSEDRIFVELCSDLLHMAPVRLDGEDELQ